MSDARPITAGVILIGNEILSGRTQDTNLHYLGQRLAALGIELAECRVIPDIEATIVAAVNHLRFAHTYVFTTGGIGPTHDDITSAAIAKAFHVDLEYNADAGEAIKRHAKSGHVNQAQRKMAYVPKGAQLIANPLSGAPGFGIENVYVMAGVPAIMQLMFDDIASRITSGAPIISLSVATDLGENTMADDLTKLQKEYPTIGIGSYPRFHNGKPSVNLVIRHTNLTRLNELKDKLTTTIARLGGSILNH